MTGEVEGLLVKLRGQPGGFAAAASSLGRFEPILEVPAGTGAGGFGISAAAPATWVRVDGGDNAWDRAHALVSDGFGADAAGVVAAEPDLAQDWAAPEDRPDKQACVQEPQTDKGGKALGPHYAWHLDDKFSGLRAARGAVAMAAQAGVTIAHLDTGYDPDHRARPRNIWHDHERNFVESDRPNDARDMTPTGGFLRNRGHGTGTIGLLAGGDPGGQPNGVTGPIGGAPGARILPVRIANSVVRFTTGTMVQGFAYAIDNHADVVSMSMGGLASAAVADAVNRAYEAGMVLVTAAGNNVVGVPSPGSIVYPARFRRVIAATGVMADGRSYSGLKLGTMQGCFGPDSKMPTALAGWTPNVPWPELGCPGVLDLDGQGTSAATPQVAAAAALWIARNRAALDAYPAKWMKAEAVRQALFAAAARTTDALDAKTVAKKLGAGALQAMAALGIVPLAAEQLVQAAVADAGWDWLKLITGRGAGVAAAVMTPRARMLALEMVQIAQTDAEIYALVADPEGTIDEATRRKVLEAVRESDRASRMLKAAIDRALGVGQRAMPAAAEDAAVAAPAANRRRPPPPADRQLRIFALDPSLGGSLKSFESKVATIDVRYEVDRETGESILRPGPVGEYLEVVDVDPASDQYYPPVDLDDPRLLIQDGLDPSEGDPHFHQQMVYAVGMRTIASFEKALGRVALWAPHQRDEDDPAGRGSEYVRRLRIYPHALRAQNAYYSPDKVALLFGYFPSQSTLADTTAPGTMVFACLSADIVAHEMTHALLDGYIPGYRQPSNPDVGAFHEAFADVIALFQHFGYRDLVRREIAQARGSLGAAGLLGGLALQFGQGTARGGPLRNYNEAPAGLDYRKTFEVHDRGQLLVTAIYEAFLAIVERRTGDLIRLATGGSGVLPGGAIHPDLVERLTQESVRAAGHVLRMCIRALDYCPPTDISFGAYLRALITADLDSVADDQYGYRTAFLESFRRHDLLPTNLRTVSIETLRWRRPRNPSPAWLADAVAALKIDWTSDLARETIFDHAEERCHTLHGLLREAMATDPDAMAELGLVPDLPLYDTKTGKVTAQRVPTGFEVRNVRAARRQGPDGGVSEQIIVILAQRRPESYDGGEIGEDFFWHCGGSTIVIDPGRRGRPPAIRYAIVKSMGNAERLERERRFRNDPPGGGLRALYFGDPAIAGNEPFAALHAMEV